MKNRLSTKDRFFLWDTSISTSCELCKQDIESRDHLFFTCQATAQVWSLVLRLLLFDRSTKDWSWELQQGIVEGKGRTLDSIIYRLIWTLYIYYVWQGRNNLLFQGKSFFVQGLFETIVCSAHSELLFVPNLTLSR